MNTIKHKFTQKELKEWSKHHANCVSTKHCVICGEDKTINGTLLCEDHLVEFNKELANPNGKSIYDMWYEYSRKHIRKEWNIGLNK